MMKYTKGVSEDGVTGNEDSIKFSTVVFFVLGLIIPFWIITLPLCWFIAYRTFKSGDGTPINKAEAESNKQSIFARKTSPDSKFENIEKLKLLLDSGALTEEEYKVEKAKILN